MHDSTRRIVCRTLFGTLCVLPTLLVMGWVVSRYMPGQAAAYATKLGREAGMSVSMSEVSYPRPGAILISDLRLVHPESGDRIASAEQVEVVRRDNETVVAIRGGRITHDGPTALWDVLFHQVLKGWDRQAAVVRLVESDIELETDDVAQPLYGCTVVLQVTAEGPKAAIRFRTDNALGRQPVQIVLSRRRDVTPPATHIDIRTHGRSLSNRLLSHYLPTLAVLGANCRLAGNGWITHDAAGWHAEWAGSLTDVDLRQLFDGLPCEMSGTANIPNIMAWVRNNRIVELHGSVTAIGRGTISRSLIEACDKQLGCTVTPPSNSVYARGDIVQFRELSFAFDIDDGGIDLKGLCSGPTEGTILWDDWGLRLGEPVNQPLAVTDLVRALVPTSRLQVPATRETETLLRVLPIPPAMASRLPETEAAR